MSWNEETAGKELIMRRNNPAMVSALHGPWLIWLTAFFGVDTVCAFQTDIVDPATLSPNDVQLGGSASGGGGIQLVQ